MELAIGQSLRQGSVGVWNAIHPYLGGVGFGAVVVSLLVGVYYNMIIAWCFFYLFASFQDPLPYASCPMVDNVTFVEECRLAGRTQYYWYRNALDITTSIDESGGLLWHLCLVLLLSWIVVFLCMMRGVISAGKVNTTRSPFTDILFSVFPRGHPLAFELFFLNPPQLIVCDLDEPKTNQRVCGHTPLLHTKLTSAEQ